jgi:hypothetical protein
MLRARRKIGYFGVLFSVVLFSSCLLARATGPDPLKYGLTVDPGDLTVDRMPTTGTPKTYEEQFSFAVANPAGQDFNGTSQDSPPYEVEVFFVGIDKEISVWRSPQKHDHLVTPVGIPAKGRWTPEEKVVWSFTAAGIKDGKYHAVATFFPTRNKTAVANFTIKSVQ